MNVLVTGGTGFVGNMLTGLLCAKDRRVTIVTRALEHARTARVGVAYAEWLPDLSRFEAVVNLAGAGIADRRWDEAYKRELRTSRVDRTRALVEALAAAGPRPRVLVNMSATGIYGDRGDEELDESSPPGDDFLARLAADWEAEALRAEAFGVRVVLVRSGVVLGRFGGALKRLVPLFKLGLGGPLGSGRQWFPWVHVTDVCGLILRALDDDALRGPYNAVAPGLVRNKEFARTLGRVLSRPALLPVPGFALRIALGEAAGALLSGKRVVPRRTLAAGYAFQHPELEGALRNLLHRK